MSNVRIYFTQYGPIITDEDELVIEAFGKEMYKDYRLCAGNFFDKVDPESYDPKRVYEPGEALYFLPTDRNWVAKHALGPNPPVIGEVMIRPLEDYEKAKSIQEGKRSKNEEMGNNVRRKFNPEVKRIQAQKQRLDRQLRHVEQEQQRSIEDMVTSTDIVNILKNLERRK